MNVEFSHCLHCGIAFADPAAGRPRKCGGCGRTTYRNPLSAAGRAGARRGSLEPAGDPSGDRTGPGQADAGSFVEQ